MKFLRKISFLVLNLLLIQTAVMAFEQPSLLFKVKLNGINTPAISYKDFSYARFIQQGPVSVEIEFLETIQNVKVSPLSKGIIATPNGDKKITFQLNAAAYTVVTINQTHRLFLFGERMVYPASSNTIMVTDYTDNTGAEIATEAIQQALNDASATGKQLIFPAGLYRSGSLFISGNTNVFFEEGAVLKGSDDVTDYVRNSEIGARIFITIKDADNVIIGGLGTIDGDGKVLRDKYDLNARVRLLTIYKSKNVKISEVTLRDPAAWNVHIYRSENILLSKMKLLGDITVPTTDGFDPDASYRVTIENCFAYNSDDNVAVKLTPSDESLTASDVIVRNCVFLTLKSSLKVGTETRGASISNVLFENNDVIQSDRGMAIYCTDGAEISNICYINNRFEENYPDLKQMGIQFRTNKRTPESRVGIIKNVLVKDCSFQMQFPNPSEITGFDNNHKTKVTFENFMINGIKRLNVVDANISPANFSDINFK